MNIMKGANNIVKFVISGVESVIRRHPNSCVPRKESMAGHVGVNGVY
jgi:hypothetical protein